MTRKSKSKKSTKRVSVWDKASARQKAIWNSKDREDADKRSRKNLGK
jgi:hypothetical protein